MDADIARLHVRPPFAFDRINQAVVAGSETRQMSPKAFAVLEYLFDRPHQLVTKNELLDAVWPEVCVVEGVLKNVVREIRTILGDDARVPTFIETVHRRGYRFVGEGLLCCESESRRLPTNLPPGGVTDTSGTALVGRSRELEILEHEWTAALAGTRRRVTITSDPRMGKTTLVDEWSRARGRDSAIVVRSRCSSATRNHEYVMFLDAFERLCDGRYGESARRLLSHCAPTWLTYMPWLSEGDAEPAGSSAPNSASSRTLPIEAAVFLEAFTREVPLVLVFDDLHHCDSASRELLDYVCTREAPARLLVVETRCRWQAYAIARKRSDGADGESLLRDGKLIELLPLDLETVKSCVAQGRTTKPAPSMDIGRLHRRGAGHPLCLDVVRDGSVGFEPSGEVLFPIPASLRRRLMPELRALEPHEYRLLRAASIPLTVEFSAAAVASILNQSVVETEEQLHRLASFEFWVQPASGRLWPDGTLAETYRFPLTVYRDFLYESMPLATRAAQHLRLAKRLEVAYGDDVPAVAENLAYHFERGADTERAGFYRRFMLNPSAESRCAKFSGLEPLRHAA